MKKFFTDLVLQCKSLSFAVFALVSYFILSFFAYRRLPVLCREHLFDDDCVFVVASLSLCVFFVCRVLYLLIKKCIVKVNKKNVPQ